MHSEVKDAGPFERVLTVRIENAELESAKNAAARKLAGQVKIKGFRPGKAPRQVVERVVGSDAVRSEAIDDSLGAFVAEALGETELVPVTAPRVEQIRDTDEGGVEVDVRITLWPTIDVLPDFAGRNIEVEPPAVSEEEIDQQLDRLRNQWAELDDVSREADEGDFVAINLTAHGPQGEIVDAAATDLLYEIGSRSFIPGLDEMLVGASAGDIREGNGRLPAGFVGDEAQDVTLKVLVKGVRAKRLPDVTDEWVSDVTEFESVEELRGLLARNMLAMKKRVTAGAFRENLVNELLDEVELEIPDALVEAEMEATLHNLYHSLESQGLDLPNYLRITGQDEHAFVDELRSRADGALRTRILLEGVAKAHGIAVEDEDVDAYVASIAAESEQDPAEVRAALEASGQRTALSGDILRRKALDRLAEEAHAVDADGKPVDLEVILETDEDDQVDEQAAEAVAVADEDSAQDADNVSNATGVD